MSKRAIGFDHVDSVLLSLLRREQIKPVEPGTVVPTPLPSWNRACRDEGAGMGLAPGWFVVIAGKPGAGKSLMALNLLISAIRAGHVAACLSYEMSQGQLLTRALAIQSGCDVKRLERGPGFNEVTFDEAVQTWFHHTKGGLLIADRPERSIQGMQDYLHEAIETYGATFTLVDYVGLVGRQEYPGIFERTQAVSGVLQHVAHDTKTTVCGLSQFNRTTLNNKAEEPGPEGVKGGSLDEDADQVVTLSLKQERTLEGAKTSVTLGKNRHGPLVTIPVEWSYSSLRVRERSSLDEAQDRIRRGNGQG